MPLDDREQKILQDIEARLKAEDPKFVRTVSSTTVTSQLRRRVKLSVAAFLVGFLLLLFIIKGIGFGLAGFAVMLAAAVYGGHQLKRLGQDQNNRLGGQLRGGFDRYLQDRRGRDEPKR